jgi:hypothetical protein
MGGRLERGPIETDNAIGDLERLFEIADENERGALAGVTPQRIDDIGACARIDALKRFVEQQQTRGLRMPAREHDFLLIAA